MSFFNFFSRSKKRKPKRKIPPKVQARAKPIGKSKPPEPEYYIRSHRFGKAILGTQA